MLKCLVIFVCVSKLSTIVFCAAGFDSDRDRWTLDDRRSLDHRNHRGLPDHRGPPDHKDPFDHRKSPDHRGLPDQIGSFDHRGLLDHREPPDHRGLPDHRGSLDHTPFDHRRPPDYRESNDHRGFLDNRKSPNFNGPQNNKSPADWELMIKFTRPSSGIESPDNDRTQNKISTQDIKHPDNNKQSKTEEIKSNEETFDTTTKVSNSITHSDPKEKEQPVIDPEILQQIYSNLDRFADDSQDAIKQTTSKSVSSGMPIFQAIAVTPEA